MTWLRVFTVMVHLHCLRAAAPFCLLPLFWSRNQEARFSKSLWSRATFPSNRRGVEGVQRFHLELLENSAPTVSQAIYAWNSYPIYDLITHTVITWMDCWGDEVA